MEAYTEPEKKLAREQAIFRAVQNLTKKRFSSTVTSKSHVRKIYDYLKKKGSAHDKEIIADLKEDEITKWEKFYLSRIGYRKPEDLKVAYLSGPNPENDIRVLTKNGILPENIWAFESDRQTYNKAVLALLSSEFPFIKIFKGTIQSHFKSLPFKFDIIYLDFCGTVDSSDTFSVVKEVFNNYKLNSPGVLITNFALPENIDLDGNRWNNIINLCANYLYPKQFTENLTNYGGGYTESAEVNSITPEKFVKKAFKNYNTFYSQFITRVLFDLPTVLIPYQRFSSDKNLIDKFFKNFSLDNLPNDRWENIVTFPTDHPLKWGLNNFIIQAEEFDKTLSKFVKQLEINPNKELLIESVELMEFFKNEDIDNQFNSDNLQKIADGWKPFHKYIFCDVFLFHQLKDILIGQLTNPYFYNVEKTFRWTYKAKKTRMFMDLVTYDECRYIFDWMPTFDMFEAGINNLDRQFTLRFAMDGIAKQRRWYNDEFFSGTAVVGGNKDGFEAKILKKRKVIN